MRFLLALMNRLDKTESAVFKYCRFSLFLKVPLVQIIGVMSNNQYQNKRAEDDKCLA